MYNTDIALIRIALNDWNDGYRTTEVDSYESALIALKELEQLLDKVGKVG
jgi:hypothetical protein